MVLLHLITWFHSNLPVVCWLQAVSEAVEDVKSSLPHLAAGTALHLEPESIYALVPQNWLQVSPRCCQMALAPKTMSCQTQNLPQINSVSLALPFAQTCFLSDLFALLRLRCCRAACCSLRQQAWGTASLGQNALPCLSNQSPVWGLSLLCLCTCTCGWPLVGCTQTMANRLKRPSRVAAQQAAPMRQGCGRPCLWISQASSREGQPSAQVPSCFAYKRAPQAAQVPSPVPAVEALS